MTARAASRASSCASALGSVHCVAMCGPLVGMHGGALAAARMRCTRSAGSRRTSSLGALAGAIGGAIDLAGRLGNVQRVATMLARRSSWSCGACAARACARAAVRSRARIAGHGVLVGARADPHARAATLRAWLVGVVNGLLPCGWLWAFVVTAGGTASPWRGAAVMLAFWLGTVPAMVGLRRARRARCSRGCARACR